jgi:anti-sigma regulatory factor (Ser/Thr protein kinase)
VTAAERREFDAHVLAIRDARRFVVAALEGWRCECPDAALIVHELATNAAIHARTPYTVTVERLDARIRISVADGDARRPRLAPRSAAAPGGRGLRIVADIATAWGVEPNAAGKVVWAELEL